LSDNKKTESQQIPEHQEREAVGIPGHIYRTAKIKILLEDAQGNASPPFFFSSLEEKKKQAHFAECI
jgi:hypothetical protein